ncbi:hypothetical protein HK414_15970 [Ramlibacter terrae]|uniref:Baseplate protein J-like domain-containing protein n=1 Tax=Ramlibacter terrae TaxID=2732511 RepID=A0ABX6P3E0_9BURK|nr:hypothetical protein HK414_15970 [Ramlibacter terrae]
MSSADYARTITIPTTVANAATYTVTIAGYSPFTVTTATTAGSDLATQLRNAINGNANFAGKVSVSGRVVTIDASANVGNVSITVGPTGTVNGTEPLDADHTRTIAMTGTAVSGAQYRVVVGTDEYVYVAPTDADEFSGVTMNTIAEWFRDEMRADGYTVQTSSGTTITITAGAGLKAITATVRNAVALPTPGEVMVSSVGTGKPTISLNGLAPVAGATYVVRIGSDTFTSDKATLTEIATDLRDKIHAHGTYNADAVRFVSLAQSWDAILGELEARIELGEAIEVVRTVTPTGSPTLAKLTLTGDVANVAFTVGKVVVRGDDVVQQSGNQPQRAASSTVRQQSVIEFEAGLPANVSYTVVIDGRTYSATPSDKVPNTGPASSPS